MYRRRRWRTFAATLALSLGSLAIPAAALADGQLDPVYNGTGYHVGTVGEGTVFSNTDTRIPMIVQANGSVVIGGSRGGFMTLARYTPTGQLDTSFGSGGFATAQFSGTPTSGPGNSGATALTTDGPNGTGNIIVAGFGASQSEFAARFTANGAFSGAAVCYAPHLIDYTARALAIKGGSVVLVGYARDRHPSIAVPGTPAVIYGQRAVVALPPVANPPVVSTTACGTYSDNGGLSLGSSGVQIDGLGHDGTPAPDLISQAGRQYDGVAANADGSYVVASTIGPDGASWVQKFSAAGVGVLDPTFNPLGATPGRLPVGGVNFHAMKLGAGVDTSTYIAGESVDAAVAGNRQMLVARVSATGALGAFGAGGIARVKVAGGNDSGQALTFQGTNIIVGGSANLGGKAAFGMVRFNAAGTRDNLFGPNGQVVTPFGAPAVNGFVTGMAVNGNFVYVSGRLQDPAGLATVSARYFATGAPAPPLPPPAASTQGVDQITTSSARITGTVNTSNTASTWWIQYGTTTAYGAATAPQPLGASTDDVDVQTALTGLAAGTVYHARVVISNTQGTVGGDDVAFTTLGTATAAGAGSGGSAGGTAGGATGGTGSKGTTPVTTKKKQVSKRCVITKVTGKPINKARSTLMSKGCKVKVVYKKSHRKRGTVLTINRKVGKKLAFHALVTVTVAKKF
jgi:uncharacterized delta-60 repeat protein